MLALTYQNNSNNTIDAVERGSGIFDHLGLFNMHPNLSAQAYSIFTSIEKATESRMKRST